MTSIWQLLVAATLAAAFAASGHAQSNSDVTPLTDEFLVDTNAIERLGPRPASDGLGNFVVTWIGESDNPSASAASVYGRLYSASGSTRGGPFVVNQNATQPSLTNTDVGMDASGNFVIVWKGFFGGQSIATATGEGIIGQRYNANGEPVGGNFAISIGATAADNDGNRFSPAIAMQDDGDFLVAWTADLDEDGSENSAVYARRYNAAGIAVGAEFQVSEANSPGDASVPRIAVTQSGEFVITWLRLRRFVDGGIDTVRAARFSMGGVQQGLDIEVGRIENSVIFVPLFRPDIALDASGNFNVAWVSHESSGVTRVHISRYSATGLRRGEDAVAPESAAGSPSLAVTDSGEINLVFRSLDSNGLSVLLRRYNASGMQVQGPSAVGQSASNEEDALPGISRTPAGDLIVAWSRTRNTDGDATNDENDIFARLFRGEADTPPSESNNVAPNPHDFGEVNTDTVSSQTFTLTNSSNTAPLSVGQLGATDPLEAPFSLLNDTCSNSMVSANNSCTFDVQFAPDSMREFVDSFDVPSDAGNVSVVVMGQGVAMNQPNLVFTPDPVDFMGLQEGNSETITVQISNEGSAGLEINDISLSDSTNFSFDTSTASDAEQAQNLGGLELLPSAGGDPVCEPNGGSNFSVPAGGSCQFDVSATGANKGMFSEKISFSSNAPGSPQAFDLIVNVTERPEPDIDVSPQPLVFGVHMIGTTTIEEITLSNSGTADLTVTALEGLESPFSIGPGGTCGSPDFTVSPDTSCTVAIQFNSVEPGEFGDSLRVTSNDPDESTITLDVSATAETDNDGIPDRIEDEIGDGNADGVQDSAQSNVASAFTESDQAITLAIESPSNATFSDFLALSLSELQERFDAGNPPEDESFPDGFISFKVQNVSPNSQAQIRVILQSPPSGAVFKFGPEPTNAMPHFFRFDQDANGTGVSNNGEQGQDFTLVLEDAGRGDSDDETGVISDPFGISTNQTSGGEQTDPDDDSNGTNPTQDPSSGNSSGRQNGGCALGNTAITDPLFPLLIIVSTLVLYRRLSRLKTVQ